MISVQSLQVHDHRITIVANVHFPTTCIFYSSFLKRSWKNCGGIISEHIYYYLNCFSSLDISVVTIVSQKQTQSPPIPATNRTPVYENVIPEQILEMDLELNENIAYGLIATVS